MIQDKATRVFDHADKLLKLIHELWSCDICGRPATGILLQPDPEFSQTSFWALCEHAIAGLNNPIGSELCPPTEKGESG